MDIIIASALHLAHLLAPHPVEYRGSDSSYGVRSTMTLINIHSPRSYRCLAWSEGAQYALRVRVWVLAVAAAVSLGILGCDEPNAPSYPTTRPGSVRIVFLGSTTRRSDLPASAQTCANNLGPTHIHPSWRNFAVIPLQPVPPDRYEIAFTDVPVDTRVSFRVNDQNACDENPTGAVTRNILVNAIRLVQNTTTPGNGDEPGFAFAIASTGIISQ